MRITLPAAFTLLALASPILYAGTDPFVGPSLAIGASIGQISNKVDPASDFQKSGSGIGTQWSRTGSSISNSSNSTQPMLDFSWNWRVAPEWVAGAGINVETGSRDGGEGTFGYLKDTGSSQPPRPKSSISYDASLKMKQHVAIYGLIGRQLNDDWLLYGKLGYHQAKADSSIQSSGPDNLTHLNTNSQQSFNLRGVGIGVGTTYSLHNGLELSAEAEYIHFNDYTHSFQDTKGNTTSITGKPNMARVNLMLGYRF